MQNQTPERAAKPLLGYVRMPLLAVIVVAGCLYIWRHREEFAVIARFDWWYAPLLVGCFLIVLTLNGLTFRQIAAGLAVDLRCREWFGLAAINSMGNYLAPGGGGIWARAVYLRRVHSLPYSHYLSGLLTAYVASVTGTCGCAWVSASVVAHAGVSLPGWLRPALLGVLVVVPLCAAILPHLANAAWLPLQFLQASWEAWQRLWRDAPMLVQVLALQIGCMLAYSLLLWLAFRSLQISVSYWAVILLAALPMLSYILTFVPGNIGVTEFCIGISAAFLDQDVQSSILAVFLVRCTTVVVVFTLGLTFAGYLTRSPVPMVAPTESTDAERQGGRHP